jgi:hypothetical protein
LAERPKNYRLGDIVTGIHEKVKSPSQQSVNKKFSREPETLNELRRQNEELKQREYALTLKSRSKRYKACSDLVRPTGFEPTTFRVGV